MSSNLPVENGLEGTGIVARPGALPPPTSPATAVLARDMRNKAVLAACREDRPESMGFIIDAAIGWAVAAHTLLPPYLTIADLMARYSKSRRWVENLPIESSKVQGSILYQRAAVLKYEDDCIQNASGGA